MAIPPPTGKSWIAAYSTSFKPDARFEEAFKSHIRDLSIDILSNSSIITVDSKKRFDKWHFLKKNNSIIQYTLAIGGVLTGSRALRCYKYKGKHIFDRSANDWDILITEDMMFKIADSLDLTIT